MLWLQHRADRWYLVGRVSNEMDQHLCRPGNCCESLFPSQQNNGKRTLAGNNMERYANFPNGKFLPNGLNLAFLRSEQSKLTSVGANVRYPTTTVNYRHLGKRHVRRSSKSEGGKRAD